MAVNAVDTNVLVRLLTRDDEAQYQRSYALFASGPVFIADTVLLETEWVLRFAYRFDAQAIRLSLRRVLGLPNVKVRNASQLAQALHGYEQGLDFADALHLATSEEAVTLKTFDEKFIKRAQGLSPCRVEQP